jgi:hypothetical protein
MKTATILATLAATILSGCTMTGLPPSQAAQLAAAKKGRYAYPVPIRFACLANTGSFSYSRTSPDGSTETLSISKESQSNPVGTVLTGIAGYAAAVGIADSLLAKEATKQVATKSAAATSQAATAASADVTKAAIAAEMTSIPK